MTKNTKTAPGENIPTAAEIDIDEAVNCINELVGNKLYETAIEVGNYVLKTFFKDDINEVKSKNPNKLQSFKKLCERSDLKIHPKHLNQMVHVAAQEKILIAGKVNQLGYSLKVELLKIQDDKLKIKTAKKWIVKPLTITEAKKYIASLIESSPAVSDLIPLSSPFLEQLKTISEWTGNEELEGKLEGLSINKIKKIKDHIDAFLEKYEPVKTKIDGVKAKIYPIYETKKKAEEEKAATPKKRGRPSTKKKKA
ncbi:MAG: hypothetical protein HY881_11200 [Deltaproteobacteria bacterium]|nr:hypothetical protein [Deltaproteobacteria bacterium]